MTAISLGNIKGLDPLFPTCNHDSQNLSQTATERYGSKKLLCRFLLPNKANSSGIIGEKQKKSEHK